MLILYNEQMWTIPFGEQRAPSRRHDQITVGSHRKPFLGRSVVFLQTKCVARPRASFEGVSVFMFWIFRYDKNIKVWDFENLVSTPLVHHRAMSWKINMLKTQGWYWNCHMWSLLDRVISWQLNRHGPFQILDLLRIKINIIYAKLSYFFKTYVYHIRSNDYVYITLLA